MDSTITQYILPSEEHKKYNLVSTNMGAGIDPLG